MLRIRNMSYHIYSKLYFSLVSELMLLIIMQLAYFFFIIKINIIFFYIYKAIIVLLRGEKKISDPRSHNANLIECSYLEIP